MLKRKSTTFAFAGICFFAAACSSADPADSKDWGEETENGPRVSGANLGMIEADGQTGVGYDVDGDGRADEIDVDGDGISDGEDIDGDGVITVWKTLRGQDLRPEPNPDKLLPPSDPDDFRALDPRVNLLHSSGSGEVTEPATSNVVGNESTMAIKPTMPKQLSWAGDILYPLSQGAQGSCNAFANAALATLLRFRHERATNMSIDANTLWASPSYIYARVLPSPTACDEGSTVADALNLLARHGAATLIEQPFRSGNMPKLCEPTTPEVAATPQIYRIGSWQGFREKGAAVRPRIKEAVAAGIPVPFGVELPDGFENFKETVAGVQVREVYRKSGKCTTSTHCDGHAMLITGYDDTRGAYRVLNSWAGDWGDRGYVWWDYAALESQPGFDAYQVIVSPDPPTALPATPPATITMTQPPGSQPVIRKVTYRSGERFTLFVRVQFDDPVKVTNLDATISGSTQSFGVDSTLSYGDLGFLLPGGDTAPAPGTTIDLTVTGTDRANRPVMKMLSVTAPAARM